MKFTAVAGLVIVTALAVDPAYAQTPGAARDSCRTTVLLLFDVPNLKITASPQSVDVNYPRPTDPDWEVCFTWVMVGGKKDDKFVKLDLKGFDTVKGRKGNALFKTKKTHDPSGDKVISLEFNDVPDWDIDKNGNFDGQLNDVRQTYTIEAKFKVNGVDQDVIFDPEVIIKKPGG